MLAAPLEQSAVPVALLATRLITQTLYGGLNVFGIGSGGPNRQPTLVQFRLLPVSVEARLPRVSAVPLHAAMTVAVHWLNALPLNPDSAALPLQFLLLHGFGVGAAVGVPNEGATLSQKRAATTVIVRVALPIDFLRFAGGTKSARTRLSMPTPTGR